MDDSNIEFTAVDARHLTSQTKQRRNTAIYRIHTIVVNRIRSRTTRGYYELQYQLPAYMFEYIDYNPEKTMRWLVERLEGDGFTVDFYSADPRRLTVGWYPKDTNPSIQSSTRRRQPRLSTAKPSQGLFERYS